MEDGKLNFKGLSFLCLYSNENQTPFEYDKLYNFNDLCNFTFRNERYYFYTSESSLRKKYGCCIGLFDSENKDKEVVTFVPTYYGLESLFEQIVRFMN